MIFTTKRLYILLITAALAGCFISERNSGITIPQFPAVNVTKTFESLPFTNLVRFSTTDLEANSSDRKLSSLFTYEFDDSSRILAVYVKVRKRDDFKIETYGLLTKGIKQIYLENSRLIGGPPFSMQSFVNTRPVYQTCIIPGQTDGTNIDVRLIPLTSVVERNSNASKNLLTRLLGTDTKRDYSCIVVTFFTNEETSEIKLRKKWNLILEKLQKDLANK